MKRVDHSTKSVDLFGPGKHGFTEGAPPTTPATVVQADLANSWQEELCRIVEAASIPLNGVDYSQVLQSIKRLNAVSSLAQKHAAVMAASGSPQYTSVAASQALQCVIAVGNDGAGAGLIEWSPDGTFFVSPTSIGGAGSNFRDVIYDDANDMALAVGAGGAIRTSTDYGDNWTARTPDASYAGQFECAAYDLASDTHYIAGAIGEVQKSVDNGVTWSRIKNGSSGDNFICLAAENDIIVGVYGLSSFSFVLSVDAGVSWETPPAWVESGHTPIDLKWVVNKFILTTCNFAADVTKIWTSIDGTAWTEAVSLNTALGANAVWGGSFVVHGADLIITAGRGHQSGNLAYGYVITRDLVNFFYVPCYGIGSIRAITAEGRPVSGGTPSVFYAGPLL